MIAGCSTGQPTSTGGTTTTSNVLAELAPGSGRLAGHVGPGRPRDKGTIPPLTLEFSDGNITVKTTTHNGGYTVDLPAGTWEVHADDGNLCATGLSVVAGARQSDALIWPSGTCQDLSGPPAAPPPPAGPSPPGR